MKTPLFEGSCTAIITPFTKDGIDYKRLGELLDFQVNNGTRAIVAAGTTGESAALEIHEYKSLVDFCVKYVSGRIKVFAGIGGNNPKRCIEKAGVAADAGVNGVLVTTPYYNKTTQRGLIEFFELIADESEKPIILYNIPQRTGMGIELDTYIRLAQHLNINGVKEASGDAGMIARIIAECGNDMYVWSGNDDNTVALMSLGARGVVSVASNIIPNVVSNLCDLCLGNNFAAAAALNRKYANFFSKLFIETNPIPIKAAMSRIGLDSGALRLPLVEISDTAREALFKCMDKVHIADAC